MKLSLTVLEKAELKSSGSVTVFRSVFNCPMSAKIYGTGTYHLWDKVDGCWVYGDVAAYIKAMTNVGLRGTDYPDNSRNVNSGGHWFEFEKQDQNPYSKVGEPIKSRWDNLVFTISKIHISELLVRGAYKTVIFSITLTIAKN